MRFNREDYMRFLFLLGIAMVLVFMLVNSADGLTPKLENAGNGHKVLLYAPRVTEFGVIAEFDSCSIRPLVGKELYISYIEEIHAMYFPELDPVIVQAVMQSESNYVPTVESYCGAVGLMQVLPKYHAWRMSKYGLSDIWDPYTNIVVGMDFLNETYEKTGLYYQALRAYGGTDRYAKYILALSEEIRQGGDLNG